MQTTFEGNKKIMSIWRGITSLEPISCHKFFERSARLRAWSGGQALAQVDVVLGFDSRSECLVHIFSCVKSVFLLRVLKSLMSGFQTCFMTPSASCDRFSAAKSA